jgi:RNA polymerase sigma factor (sigma-70 family)
MSDEVEKPLTNDVIEKLVESHRELLRFVEKRVGNRADAEDILQEAFVRGMKNASAVRDEDSSAAWFYRTLRNAVVDHFRRRGAAARAYESFAHELDEASAPIETKEMTCACIQSLADTLKPEYATAVKRVDVDGLPVQAFAEEAGISANNAAVRLHRAREALRKRVVTTCGTCAEHGCVDCTCGS